MPHTVPPQGVHPLLFQLNTRVCLQELGRDRVATLDEVDDAVLDGWAADGFDWIWLLGVWEIGAASVAIAREHEGLCREYARALPDWRPEDVQGSPFSVAAYRVRDELGGDEALARFRARLGERGLRLMLDFVPNHTARDHGWCRARPELYVQGDEDHLAAEPSDWFRAEGAPGRPVLAHGRDPCFPGWSDTAQLDHRLEACQQAMVQEMLSEAARSDGVRCDMAMLLLPEVFARTWDGRAPPAAGMARAGTGFWERAVPALRAVHPDFVLVAEVYWDLEHRLQELGFDYTYDKRLYDRLRAGDAAGVRAHLEAGEDFQRRSVRFVENHDEARAAAALPTGRVEASTLVALTLPGMRLVHEGQREGARRHLPVQLARRAPEPGVPETVRFHDRLRAALGRPELRRGTWRLGEPRSAWEGNSSWQGFVTHTWGGPGGEGLLVAANLGSTRGQCWTSVPLPGLAGRRWQLRDLLGADRFLREGDELASAGLYLEMPAGGYHLLVLEDPGGAGDERDDAALRPV